MKRPNARSPRERIIAWIKEHWRNSQWGLIDCDRCRERTGNPPCDNCPRWDNDLIENFKKRNR